MTAPATTPAPPARPRRLSPFPRLRRLPGAAAVSVAVIAVLALLSVAALFITPLDTRSVFFDQALQPPSPAHLMGTDSLGRDLFTRVLHAMRTSSGISIVAALCAATLGALVGLAAGSAGRRFDAVAMRLIDVLSSQNHFLFGILILVLSRPLVGPAAVGRRDALDVGSPHRPRRGAVASRAEVAEEPVAKSTAPEPAPPLVDLRALTVRFRTEHGVVQALGGVDLAIQAGEAARAAAARPYWRTRSCGYCRATPRSAGRSSSTGPTCSRCPNGGCVRSAGGGSR